MEEERGTEVVALPYRRRRRVAGALALLLVASLFLVWIARKPIASRFIDKELARRGVPARYQLSDLGFGRQRLTDVVIGDPAHPDLVADWIETETGVGFSGARLLGIRAGHVRLAGRLVDGRVSLGSIDRLLPPPSGKPFALPAIGLDLVDGRMRLATPAGPIALVLSGRGRLDDGFAGRLAATAPRLASAGCTVTGLRVSGRIRISDGRPSLAGTMAAKRLPCKADGVTLAGLDAIFDVSFAEGFNSWRGQVSRAAVAAIGLTPGTGAKRVHGSLNFAGNAERTSGRFDIGTGALGWSAQNRIATARQGRVQGRFAIGRTDTMVDATVQADGARLDPGARPPAARRAAATVGTPVAPLAAALAKAANRAADDFALAARVSLQIAGGQGAARIADATLASRSGARASLSGGSGVVLGWPRHRIRIATTLTTAGGGLPTARVSLAQAAPDAPVSGVANVAPFAAGGARVALTPVRFSVAPSGAATIETRAIMSGPLGDGRVDGLSLPVAARWDGAGGLTVNTACAPLRVERLAVAGLSLQPTGVTLCPVDGAWFSLAANRVGGGVRIGPARLAGRLGGTPLAVTSEGTTLRLGSRAFTATGLAFRLGNPARITRIAIADLAGALGRDGLAGRFAGAAGQIGAVPLVLSDAAGSWALAGGALRVNGALKVADTAKPARFEPLTADGVTLSLAQGRIAATGVLRNPASGRAIAEVRLSHVLASGTGSADLHVAGVAFDQTFQPEQLTRLTFGVIAEVRGTVSGDGHIGWSPAGVTSSGSFGTTGTDLAAAFGPVSGLAGTIHFTDLLGLQSAPGQVATVRSINPGIPVTDGRIVYQTLGGARVRVEKGRWPFAGGTLTLDPTLLDFSAPAERHLTFRVDGASADQFLQQFDFKNLDATGIFDGALPMVFDQAGGRIEAGRLTARPGGGTLAYVGAVSQKDLGVWGNLAFQALKSLRYRELGIVMNGPLAGEMVTEVRFAGVSQGEGAKSNVLIRRLARLPFVFNIRIRAPFRGLLNSAASFYDPKRLIERNLPALIEEQNKRAARPIQPPVSETVP